MSPRRRWAEVPGGLRGRRRGRPPGEWRGGSARPAPFLRPRSPRGTPRPLATAPPERARSAAPLPSPAVGSSRRPPEALGRAGRGDRRRGPAAAAPSHAPQRQPGRAPLSGRSLYPGRDNPPAPSSVRRPRFLLRKEGCPAPHRPVSRSPPPPFRTPGGRASGVEV